MEVEKCKTAWNNANSDTEKFAALLVISKILQNSELSEVEKKEVFKIIGFKFLYKLCLYEDESESTLKHYKILAIAILSCFSRISDIANDPQMLLFVPSIIDMLSTDTPSLAISDTLDIIASITSNSDTRQNLLDNGILRALLTQYKLANSESSKILTTLIMFVLSEKCDFNDVSLLVQTLSQEFCAEKSLKKFEIADYLIAILLKYGDTLTYETSLDLQKSLTEILRSKIGKLQRDSALKLAGIVTHKFGSKWLTDGIDESMLFFKVIVQITTIEVCMILEEKSVEEVGGEIFLLCSCYIILETIVEVMVTYNESQRRLKYTEQLCNSINRAFRSVVGFVRTLSDDWRSGKNVLESSDYKDLIVPTIRALCCWLAEETYAFQDEVLDVLPFVLEVCRQSASLSFCSKTMADCKVFHFCVAPLCHLTADDKARQILIDNDLLSLLFQEFESLWTAYQEKQFPESDRSLLLSLCGVFLNIVVLESKLVSEKEEFFAFLKLLFSALPQLPTDSLQLPVKANFSVLGLFITKQHYKKVKSCESSFYGFLSSSIKFLWDAHAAQESDGTTSLAITYDYSVVWSDIMELWFLGIQVLSTLLPLMPWVGNFLLESGWPQQIISTFSTVSEAGLEGNLKSTYQAFLCSLVEVSKEATTTLINCNSIRVCNKHKLIELEGLLKKST